MQRSKHAFLFLFALAGLVVLLGLSVAIGSIDIPFGEVIKAIFSKDSSYSDILWQFRIPKALTCVLAGAALGASGLLMQSLFRNPLAGPDVLGLSAGSSLFVALLILGGQAVFSIPAVLQPWSIAVAASIGSGLVFLLVMGLAQRVSDNASLLIIGLMIASLVSSIVGVLQYISRADDLQAFIIWSMGNVGGTGWDEISVLGITLGAGILITLLNLKAINGLLLGENYARSLGIQTERSRFWIVTATSLMAGGVTAFCGPIAFVGLAVPHLVRWSVATTNHRVLLPLVMIAGALLLLACDLIAQLPGSAQLLPLNAITSLMGAPVVIWVIIQTKKLRL